MLIENAIWQYSFGLVVLCVILRLHASQITVFTPNFELFCSSRPHLGSSSDYRYPLPTASEGDALPDPYNSTPVLRRTQKGRLAALRDEPSKVTILAIILCF